jgi:hypothetical protein
LILSSGKSDKLLSETEFDEDANAAMAGDGRRKIGKFVDTIVFELVQHVTGRNRRVFDCSFSVVKELAPQIEVHAFVQGNGTRDVRVLLLEAGTDQVVAS